VKTVPLTDLAQTSRTCNRCRRPEPEIRFYPSRRTGICTGCENTARSARRTPEENRRWHRVQKLKGYGLTLADYDRMFTEQGGVCAICRRPSPDGRNLHVDHAHDSGAVRGLLCHDCNRGLGMFRDNPELLSCAARYLGCCE
jgi:hypothetical protein